MGQCVSVFDSKLNIRSSQHFLYDLSHLRLFVLYLDVREIVLGLKDALEAFGGAIKFRLELDFANYY